MSNIESALRKLVNALREPGIDVEDIESVYRALLDAEEALRTAVEHEDTARLRFVYSPVKTNVQPLVKLEMRLLNGEVPTIEEVREGIDAARTAGASNYTTKQFSNLNNQASAYSAAKLDYEQMLGNLLAIIQQERVGDRVKGSVRSSDFRVAEALRAVLAYVDGVKGDK